MALKDWSATPATNATAPGINWATGAAPSTVHPSARQMMADIYTRFGEVISITDGGAIGDGTAGASGTNNTTAIQAALTRAGIVGADCYIPATSGFYDVFATLTVPDGVRVFGPGTIRMRATEQNVLVLGNNCTVDGVGIEGFNAATGTPSFDNNNGIFASGKVNVTIRNCRIYKCGFNGIQVRACSNLLIEGNRFWLNQIVSISAADICVYSGSVSQSTTIVNNFCLSNNSQGIYFNSLGQDVDAVISGNHCRTVDTTLSGWPDLAAASLVRRHGIICGYTGGGSVRLLVTNNNCRNTRWTGIYKISGTAIDGTIAITGNMISNTGINSETGVGIGASGGLCGGIYVNSTGNEIVANNVVNNAGNTIQGAITVLGSSSSANPSIIGNGVSSSGTHGIMLTNALAAAVVQGNNIIGSAGSDIRVELAAGSTAIGDIDISGNSCVRGNANVASIYYNGQSAVKTCRIKRNTLRGLGTAFSTASTYNGIQVFSLSTVIIEENDIEGFNRGVDYAVNFATFSASFGYHSRNTFRSCAVGVGVPCTSATSTFLLDGNLYLGVTTPIDGGSLAGSVCALDGRRIGTKIEASATAIPTTGFGSVGDRRINSAPAVGSPKAWSCTVANSPGTWVSEGNL